MLPKQRILLATHAVLVCLATSFAALGNEPTEFLESWIADAIPRQYEKREDWGRTRRVTTGLDVSRRGLRLKKKQVPHGVWKHYRVNLTNAAEHPHIQIEDLRSVSPGRVRASVHFSAPLDFWGRTRVYAQGVHLGTYTAEASAAVYLDLDCELSVRVEADRETPSVVVEPIVHRAEVTLRNFRIRRISHADGPAVREISKIVKHVLEDELEPHKLTKQLNRAIAKKQDRLRWDLAGFMKVAGFVSNDE